ncbi:MAG: SAM-dependent methyltransferase [Bryobacteraceae bacterium]
MTSASPGQILASVSSGRQVIQDFCPMAASIDWELGQLFWEVRGGGSFTSHEVPYTVNNDGRLSASAASILFQSLLESEVQGGAEGPIRVLELGVGSGLFARFFLEVFSGLCREQDKNFYDRLIYVAADASERILADLAASGVLADHADHCEIKAIDAMQLGARDGEQFHAVFLNYVLDALPATVLQVDEISAGQLYLRTYLARGTNLKDHTNLAFEEIVRRATSSEPELKRELIDLFHLFSLEGQFRPASSTLPHLDFAVEFARRSNSHSRYVLHNYAALQCLEDLLGRLSPGGFILVNDYGIASAGADANETYSYQHFGASTAIGLNFQLLGAYFGNRGCCYWIEPEGDSPRIFSRMLCREVAPKAAHLFRTIFSRAAHEYLNQPLEAARKHLTEGRREAALVSYREALELQPDNWVLLGEVARFLSAGLHDHEAGLTLARRAAAINPISAEVWNTTGDCLVSLGRIDEAEQAFLEALRLSPREAGARYSLVDILMRRNQMEEALQLIAKVLADDRTGEYRDRLMQRQGEVLARFDHVRQQRSQMLADRLSGVPRRQA